MVLMVLQLKLSWQPQVLFFCAFSFDFISHVIYCVGISTLYLGLCAGLWFCRELNLCGFEDGVFLQNVLLRLVVTKGLVKKQKTKTKMDVTLLSSCSGHSMAQCAVLHILSLGRKMLSDKGRKWMCMLRQIQKCKCLYYVKGVKT